MYASTDYDAFLLNPKLFRLASISKKILVLEFLIFIRYAFFRWNSDEVYWSSF